VGWAAPLRKFWRKQISGSQNALNASAYPMCFPISMVRRIHCWLDTRSHRKRFAEQLQNWPAQPNPFSDKTELMGNLLNIVTPLHKSTKRDYVARMIDDKVHCMLKAKEYEFDYWDGDRRYGYGGYRYDGRWKPVAQKLIETYRLEPGSKILDVGCGKAHLLYELSQLLPQAEVHG